jgi:hypothetical protein
MSSPIYRVMNQPSICSAIRWLEQWTHDSAVVISEGDPLDMVLSSTPLIKPWMSRHCITVYFANTNVRHTINILIWIVSTCTWSSTFTAFVPFTPVLERCLIQSSRTLMKWLLTHIDCGAAVAISSHDRMIWTRKRPLLHPATSSEAC